MKTERVRITEEYIKLDSLLKTAGAAVTGGQAKLLIQSGRVRVNGVICTVRGKKMRPGDTAGTDDMIIEVSAG